MERYYECRERLLASLCEKDRVALNLLEAVRNMKEDSVLNVELVEKAILDAVEYLSEQ